jgi:protein-S-isoprenylcysteine O-methyltransferase Ste14
MSRFIIPPVWFLLASLLMLVVHRLFPGPLWLPQAWGWIGVIPALCGVCGAVWAAWLFRRARTPVEPWQQPTALVADGPYRLTRNPMYLGLTSVLLGFALWLGSTTPLLVIPAFMWVITRNFIQREERWLEEQFGAAYRSYKARVRRWI